MMAVHYKASGDQVKDLVSGIVNMGWGPAAGSVAQLVKAGPHALPSYLDANNLGPWGNYLQQVDRVTPYLGTCRAGWKRSSAPSAR
jgi:hypothetical protein